MTNKDDAIEREYFEHLQHQMDVGVLRQRAEAAERERDALKSELEESGKAYAAKAYTVAELSRICSEVTAERDALKRAMAWLESGMQRSLGPGSEWYHVACQVHLGGSLVDEVNAALGEAAQPEQPEAA